MTRAQEKTAIGKFISACSKYDKRIANMSYNKVFIGRPDRNNVFLTFCYRGHTYEGTFNIKDIIPS